MTDGRDAAAVYRQWADEYLEEHYDDLMFVVRKALRGDPHIEAEEAMAEVVWRKLPSVLAHFRDDHEKGASLEGWVGFNMRLYVKKWIARFHIGRRRNQSLPDGRAELWYEDVVERDDCLAELFARLTPQERYVLRAHAEGLSFAEMGARMCVSDGAAHKRYTKALDKAKTLTKTLCR